MASRSQLVFFEATTVHTMVFPLIEANGTSPREKAAVHCAFLAQLKPLCCLAIYGPKGGIPKMWPRTRRGCPDLHREAVSHSPPKQASSSEATRNNRASSHNARHYAKPQIRVTLCFRTRACRRYDPAFVQQRQATLIAGDALFPAPTSHVTRVT